MSSVDLRSLAASEATLTEHAIVPGLSPDSYGVYASAMVRIYHSPLGRSDALSWTGTQLKGLLILGKDRTASPVSSCRNAGADDAGSYWFRLVDQKENRVVWMFKIPTGLCYSADRPFFHTFKGRSRQFGFLFDDDAEASSFCDTAQDRFGSREGLHAKRFNYQRPKKITSKALHSMISAPNPNSFVHKAHIAVKPTGQIEVGRDLDPIWHRLVAETLKERNKRASSLFSSHTFSGLQNDIHPKIKSAFRVLTNKI